MAADRGVSGRAGCRAVDIVGPGGRVRALLCRRHHTLHLYSTDTANYRDNLATGAPKLWVVMRPDDHSPPVEISIVTADPAEGEASTEAGSNVVETLAMPPEIAGAIAGFIAEHHVERPMIKRKRDSKAPGTGGRSNGEL
jgi:hypothetical protein